MDYNRCDMNLANKITIERMTDHFVLRFSMCTASDKDVNEEPVAVVAVPLTTAMELALGTFEAMMQSILDLQAHFAGLQGRIDAINRMSSGNQEVGKGTPSGGR